MKMKTAIFDLDGTLLNTLGDLCDSVNCAIVPRGFPAVDEELTRQRVGNGVAWKTPSGASANRNATRWPAVRSGCVLEACGDARSR